MGPDFYSRDIGGFYLRELKGHAGVLNFDSGDRAIMASWRALNNAA